MSYYCLFHSFTKTRYKIPKGVDKTIPIYEFSLLSLKNLRLYSPQTQKHPSVQHSISNHKPKVFGDRGFDHGGKKRQNNLYRKCTFPKRASEERAKIPFQIPDQIIFDPLLKLQLPYLNSIFVTPILSPIPDV